VSCPGVLRRWRYRCGRPDRVAAFLDRVDRAIASAGLWPSRSNTLEVRSRRSGCPTSFPVVVADYQGERYLVAMLGQGVNWVANVRAAGSRPFQDGPRASERPTPVEASREPAVAAA
jgi:hypothetical protein